ncbi:MAG: RNA methyltransferase [Thiobacillus sp.]|nr:RNA methyltransferase [Thiobacillus sp.]
MKHIASRDNPTFRHLHGLARNARDRRGQRQTLLDGEHLLEAALQAGLKPCLLAFAESYPQTALAAWLYRLGPVPSISLADGLFAALSPVETPTGVLAVLDIPERVTDDEGFILLLEDIQDPGNLGALLRVAAAAGGHRVCLSKGCAEAWSPKCLRGGQGAQFQLAVQEGVDLESVARDFPGPVYAGMLGVSRSLYDLDLSGRVGFAFGNEGAGLSRELQAACQPFSIPMPGRVESLNVATAAAVCLFERVRQIS